MLIVQPDQETMICESHSHICDFHKQNPGKNYAGCTCSGSYGFRKKTKRELKLDKKMQASRDANRISHKTADSLMSSIREMVHAEVTGDGAQYSRHETVVRNELNELYGRLGALEYFVRQRLGRR